MLGHQNDIQHNATVPGGVLQFMNHSPRSEPNMHYSLLDAKPEQQESFSTSDLKGQVMQRLTDN